MTHVRTIFGLAVILLAATAARAAPPDAWLPTLDRGLRHGYRAESAVVVRGRAQAQAFCTGCHVISPPDALPKRGWVEVFRKLLPMFSSYGMITGVPNLAAPRGEATRAGFAQPPIAMRSLRISKADLDAIVDYYLSEAPDESVPLPAHPAMTPWRGVRLASTATLLPGSRDTQYTAAYIDTERHRLLLGDAGRLDVRDLTQKTLQSLPLPGVPTDIVYRPDGLYVTVIGPNYYPSDDALGKVVRFGYDALDPGKRAPPPVEVLTNLRRPVHTVFADLDRDGTVELIVEEFGMTEGGLVIYKRTPAGTYAATPLLEGGGMLGSAVSDVDGDGRLDVFGLMSQYDEGPYFFINRGTKGFETRRIVREPPTFGYNSMALADVNGDGLADVITANGDSTSLTSMYLKRYQGVRVYLAQKGGAFAESYFYPMPGALIVKAADFDGDGDIDLASTAFFAEREGDGKLADTAVFLENVGGAKFSPHAVPGASQAVCTDIAFGDLEGDGDVDMLVSAAYPDLMKPIYTRSFGKRPYRYLYVENLRARK